VTNGEEWIASIFGVTQKFIIALLVSRLVFAWFQSPNFDRDLVPLRQVNRLTGPINSVLIDGEDRLHYTAPLPKTVVILPE
jgi:hypothetical protein